MKDNKRYALIIRIVICVLLLAYVLKKAHVSDLLNTLSSSAQAWPWLILGVVITFLGLLMGVIRWALVLKAQNLPHQGIKAFSIFFVGQFFNAFMLGACGGDAARAIMVAREAPGMRAEAASTVFVDRAIGLFTLIVFCCVMIAFRLPLFLSDRATQGLEVVMLCFLLGSMSALFVLFRRNLFEHWSFFRKLENSGKLGNLIRRTYDAFYVYRSRPGTLVVAVLLSFLNLFFLTLACYSFGLALKIDIAMIDYFTFFPIITVLAAIPLTPGGLGLREGLFVETFESVGVAPDLSLALSILVYLGGVVWSLFGGILFIGYSSGTGHGLKDEFKSIQNESQQ